MELAKEAVQKGMVLREEVKEFNVFSKHLDLWNKIWWTRKITSV